MNVLVLGGAGFLGSNLVRRCLSDTTNSVVVVDSLEPRLRSSKDNLADVWGSIRFVQGDIRDENLLNKAVDGQDVIFNCAAQTSHPISLQDPVMDAETNCVGNLKVLEAVRRRNKGARFLYPSTSTVVGRATTDVIDETHVERPLDIYSAHKGVAEKHCQVYANVHDLKTVVLRFPNLYGPYGKGFPEFGFVNYFIHLAYTGKEITVYGPGDQSRNLLYVGDAVDAMYESAFNNRLTGGVYFVAHDEHPTVLEIAREIVAVFGRGQVANVEWPNVRRRIEVESVRISSERFRELANWAPGFSLKEGLIRTREVMEGSNS